MKVTEACASGNCTGSGMVACRSSDCECWCHLDLATAVRAVLREVQRGNLTTRTSSARKALDALEFVVHVPQTAAGLDALARFSEGDHR